MHSFVIMDFRRMRGGIRGGIRGGMHGVLLICLVIVACLISAAVGAAEDEWVYVMRPGDTLIGIAEANFANPGDWPLVQARNRIADPYRIPTGTRLKIPFALLRADPIAAEVLLVNGQVFRTRVDADAGDGQPLAAGDALRAGDGVRVADGSNLSLRFPDGSRLLVLEKTRFILRLAARLGESGRQQIEIDLHEGSIESSVVVAPTGARPQYEIRTPPLRMAVRGTRFRATMDAVNSNARSEVLAGRVQLSGTRRSLLLAAGFGSLAETGKAPQPARQLLAAPELVDPPRRVETLPMRFGWTPVANADGYRAQILDHAGNLLLDGVFANTTARWADLPDGRYSLRVRAIDADRLEGLDAEHAFTLDARPEPPLTRSPPGKIYGDAARFEWTAGASDDRYHFQLAADADFAQLQSDEALLAATEVVRPLAPGAYYWRVATVAADGEHGPFGDAVAIDLHPVPASPPLDAPAVDDQQLHFRWRDGGRGETYGLQLASTPDFAYVLFEQVTSQPSIDVPRPAAGEYYLRVRAIEPDGFVGPFSAPQRFTVSGPTPWWLLLLLVPFAL